MLRSLAYTSLVSAPAEGRTEGREVLWWLQGRGVVSHNAPQLAGARLSPSTHQVVGPSQHT
jgi:hypothetical protein